MRFIFITLTFFSTFLGGLFGLKYRNKMNLILGLTAGVILGVTAFDIFPEARSKNSSMKTVLMTVIGVLFIFLITRIL